MSVTRDQIEAVLRTVFDPEIPVNVYDLGLVYGIDVEGVGDVHMNLTFEPPWSKEMMSEEARLELGFL
jgi:metal-sulfur cluster biosynthetic enzyme